MPASGARSGTKPSRAGRGGGSGRPAGLPLLCGHDTTAAATASFTDTRKNLFQCPQGCGLVRRLYR